jgi:membrane protease YdiL (CAAX protease family)
MPASNLTHVDPAVGWVTNAAWPQSTTGACCPLMAMALLARPTLIATAVALAAYMLSLAVLARMPGASLADKLVEPLFLLAVLGGVFPALTWLLTRGRGRGHDDRPRWSTPSKRLAGPLLYLAAFAVLVLGWGFTALQAQWPDEPTQSVAQTLLKLATMVVLPVLLFLRGSTLRPRFGTARLWWVFIGMALAFVAFQAVFGRGLTTLRELAPAMTTLLWAIPLCWLWQVVEAGLCEEVLFRRILQQRIADATRSQVAAVLWASLLFGLAHAPGLYLRGAHAMEGVAETSVPWAVAYSIVMIAPAGIAFGVLWARTRSLWLVVALHGTVDLLPQLAPFIRAWSG